MSVRLGSTVIAGLASTDTKANTDLDNLTTVGKNIANWSSNITNCIIEAPNNIKLSLSDNTLTLASGSKVYIPNGVGVFNDLTTSSDLAMTLTTDGVYLVAVAVTGTSMTARTIENSVSGAGATTTSGFAYNTTTNIINNYSATGGVGSQYSFPIAKITVSDSAITEINNVFNYIGFIGNEVFVLPRVKGLIPKGFNDDGTPNNQLFETTNVTTATFSASGYVRLNSLGIGTGVLYYSNVLNRNYSSNIASTRSSIIGAEVRFGSQKIASISTRNVFSALSYSDSEEIAGFFMPGDNSTNLTLGATGASYTAIENGWVCVQKRASATGQYLTIYYDKYNGLGSLTNSASISNQALRVFLPIRKGDSFRVVYTAGGETQQFKFIYAEGVKM